MSRPADELPLDVDYGGAVPGSRAVPPDQHPWAPSVLNDWPNIGDTCCGKCGQGLCYVDQITGA